ncbi:hypothetical protein QVD17_07209 [Tagetes erecta]|uniref:Uncharacterized protein n=1 Tax=Tagetes erecta TaxID=13708 RepID=A0AAD8LFR3_TARER|nr:hypothetical protein QVD17_07209 [Tagetes erecta]
MLWLRFYLKIVKTEPSTPLNLIGEDDDVEVHKVEDVDEKDCGDDPFDIGTDDAFYVVKYLGEDGATLLQLFAVLRTSSFVIDLLDEMRCKDSITKPWELVLNFTKRSIYIKEICFTGNDGGDGRK